MPSRAGNRAPWCFGVFAAGVIVAGALASLLGTPDLAEARTNRGLAEEIVLFVDDDAPAGGDGSTWKSAFRFLQDALGAAREIIAVSATDPTQTHVEVRVAQGVYKPDQGQGQTSANTNATFLVIAGMSVRGGYAGIGANDPDARDFQKFESVLHGDLLGNDPPVVWPPPPNQPAELAENSLHIMTVQDAVASTLIEGLTFTKSRYSSTIENLGGGLLGIGGSPVIQWCTFRHNRAWRGGGIGLDRCDATVRQCTFHQNFANFAGALHIGSFYGATLGPSDVVIEDSEFTQNRCGGGTAGAVSILGSAMIRRSSFIGNVAPMAANGGAITTGNSPCQIEDCYFEGNAGDNGGAINGNPRIFRSTFHDNHANWAGAIFDNSDLPLECYDCRFTENFANFYGGAILGAGTFVNCEFDNNSVFWDYGGAVAGSGNFINCRFTRNSSNLNGGGAVRSGTMSRFVNCLFAGNTTNEEGGGAVRVVAGGQAEFVNCTLLHNSSNEGADAIAGNAQTFVRNSIIWANGDLPITGNAPVTYSCVEGGHAGVGNIASDPALVDPVGPDGVAGTQDDDVRLSDESPCIDAADSLATPHDDYDLDSDGNFSERVPHDLASECRFLNDPGSTNIGQPQGPHPVVDMGVMEFNAFPFVAGDTNADNAVDVDDLIAVILAWNSTCDVPCGPDVSPQGGDSQVSVDDLLVVILNWQS